MRRRSHSASNAYRPALVSFVSSSSGVASLASTMRSTVPNSPRTTRPSSAGSAENTLARAMAASSARRASSTASMSEPVTSGHVARQDEDLGRVGRDALEGDAHGVAGPGGRRLEGERRPIGERGGDRLDRGRVDDDRRGARRPRRPCSTRRRGRTRASGGRTARGGPWGSSSACACRGLPPGRRRLRDRSSAGRWGSRGAPSSPAGRANRMARDARWARRWWVGSHQKGPGMVGVARSGCQPTRWR